MWRTKRDHPWQLYSFLRRKEAYRQVATGFGTTPQGAQQPTVAGMFGPSRPKQDDPGSLAVANAKKFAQPPSGGWWGWRVGEA